MATVISRVTTRTGDRGKTGLVGNVRVSKSCHRLEALGAVDELCAFTGMARTLVAESRALPLAERNALGRVLRRVQNDLFLLCNILATPEGLDYEGQPEVGEARIRWLEEMGAKYNEGLPPLRSFVLPGGCLENASLHQCRTVCRRAERDVVRLSELELVSPEILAYLNRLSDLFFILARYTAKAAHAEEYLWERS